MDSQRQNILAELEVALQELESDEGLTRFVAGHGIQSRFFAFEWKARQSFMLRSMKAGPVTL